MANETWTLLTSLRNNGIRDMNDDPESVDIILMTYWNRVSRCDLKILRRLFRDDV